MVDVILGRGEVVPQYVDGEEEKANCNNTISAAAAVTVIAPRPNNELEQKAKPHSSPHCERPLLQLTSCNTSIMSSFKVVERKTNRAEG